MHSIDPQVKCGSFRRKKNNLYDYIHIVNKYMVQRQPLGGTKPNKAKCRKWRVLCTIGIYLKYTVLVYTEMLGHAETEGIVDLDEKKKKIPSSASDSQQSVTSTVFCFFVFSFTATGT